MSRPDLFHLARLMMSVEQVAFGGGFAASRKIDALREVLAGTSAWLVFQFRIREAQKDKGLSKRSHFRLDRPTP